MDILDAVGNTSMVRLRKIVSSNCAAIFVKLEGENPTGSMKDRVALDQLNNHDSIAGYFSLGEEIWTQTEGKVDAFVQSVGTVASLRGVATVLRRYNPNVEVIAVEPAESSVLCGNPRGDGPPPGPRRSDLGRHVVRGNVVAALRVAQRLGPPRTGRYAHGRRRA